MPPCKGNADKKQKTERKQDEPHPGLHPEIIQGVDTGPANGENRADTPAIPAIAKRIKD